jgi:serine/threonine protein kinase
MFRYNSDKVLEHKKLGGTQNSWVSPYKESHNENEWVVKQIYAKNQEEMNDVLQNIFLTTSSGFSGLAPIKGYDVKANERGDYNIYCKVPRMVGSLKSVIDREYSADNLLGSAEKLVLLLHSLVSTLDELAHQRTFHRNLKPTNILLDKSRSPLLSDLKMLQSSVKISSNDSGEDLIYVAPEMFNDDWTVSEDDDMHKADVWSLGMIMAKLCLLDKLSPIPINVPLQETQEAVDSNIDTIKSRYGANLSRLLAEMLNINPVLRKTFREIRSMLEETFLYTLVRYYLIQK